MPEAMCNFVHAVYCLDKRDTQVSSFRILHIIQFEESVILNIPKCEVKSKTTNQS